MGLLCGAGPCSRSSCDRLGEELGLLLVVALSAAAGAGLRRWLRALLLTVSCLLLADHSATLPLAFGGARCRRGRALQLLLHAPALRCTRPVSALQQRHHTVGHGLRIAVAPSNCATGWRFGWRAVVVALPLHEGLVVQRSGTGACSGMLALLTGVVGLWPLDVVPNR